MLTVEICTKDRYDCLSNTIQSIVNQTFLPQEIIIFDDSTHKTDLRQISIYNHLFKILEIKKIKWKVEFSPCHGQVKNHIAALQLCQTPYIYRCDDDHILEPNVLEGLFSVIQRDNKIGAVCNTILHTDCEFSEHVVSPYIEDVLFKYAVNFSRFDGLKEVQHIYSSFMGQTEALKGCYANNLSTVGHREESICTHNLYKKGFKLYCKGDIFTWHVKNSKGGIRTFNDAKMWESDDKVFYSKLQEWGVKLNNYFVFACNGAIGDNYMLRNIIPDIKNKHKDKKLVLGTVYPDIYFDAKEIEIVSLHDAQILNRGNLEKFDIYKYCFENNWNKTMIEAYRKLYDV